VALEERDAFLTDYRPPRRSFAALKMTGFFGEIGGIIRVF
jgi:hypothetical protein